MTVLALTAGFLVYCGDLSGTKTAGWGALCGTVRGSFVGLRCRSFWLTMSNSEEKPRLQGLAYAEDTTAVPTPKVAEPLPVLLLGL